MVLSKSIDCVSVSLNEEPEPESIAQSCQEPNYIKLRNYIIDIYNSSPMKFLSVSTCIQISKELLKEPNEEISGENINTQKFTNLEIIQIWNFLNHLKLINTCNLTDHGGYELRSFSELKQLNAMRKEYTQKKTTNVPNNTPIKSEPDLLLNNDNKPYLSSLFNYSYFNQTQYSEISTHICLVCGSSCQKLIYKSRYPTISTLCEHCFKSGMVINY